MRTFSAGRISITTGMLVLAGTMSAYGIGANNPVAAPAQPEDGKAGAYHGGADVYGIVNLGGPLGFVADINARGQVAFEFTRNSNEVRVGFFNRERVIDITPPGGTVALMGDLNDKGEVTFASHSTPSGAPRTEPIVPFRWSASRGPVPLPTLSSDGDAFTSAINNRSEIVGRAQPAAGGSSRAVRWTAANRLIPLPTPAGIIGQTNASDINDSNVAVGYGETAGDGAHVLVWDAAGRVSDLGSFGANTAVGNFINKRGDIAGVIAGGNVNFGAFLWSPGKGVVRPGEGTVPHQLSEAGELVGRRLGADFQPRAFLFSRARGLVNLHPASFVASEANDVNDSGVVVGLATRTAEPRAYRWSRSGGAVDLNTRLLNPPSGLVVTSALGISNNGDIIANSNAGVVLLRAGGGGTDAPVVGPLQFAGSRLVNQPLALTVSFSDRNVRDTHTVTVDWGDGSGPQALPVREYRGRGTARGTHTYTAARFFNIVVRVRDSSGKTTRLEEQFRVFPPGIPGLTGEATAQGGGAQASADPRAAWAVGNLPRGAVPPVK